MLYGLGFLGFYFILMSMMYLDFFFFVLKYVSWKKRKGILINNEYFLFMDI